MMPEIRFLELEDVIEIHREGIEEHGGSLGVRDLGLIESALASARNLYEYSSADCPEMAAAYMFSLCKNHGFVDGNKRVALRSADVFLCLNGLDLRLTPEVAYDLTVRVATSECSRGELAEIIRQNVEPLE